MHGLRLAAAVGLVGLVVSPAAAKPQISVVAAPGGHLHREVRRGAIPRGNAKLIPASSIPPAGLCTVDVCQGTLNLHAVARGPQTRGYMSDMVARRARACSSNRPIERVNVYDVINEPTLDEMRQGKPFLQARGLGRMVNRTIEALGLKPVAVTISGVTPRSPKLDVYITVAPRAATAPR